MGLSTHIVAFRPPDAQWKAMKAVWDCCKQANITVPEVVCEFFNWHEPSEHGIEIKLDAEHGLLALMGDHSGYEVELAKLPDSITHIKFYNSY